MNGFQVHLDQLTRRAGELDDLAGRADRIAAELRDAVESSAGCWGSDDIGQRFAATHDKPARDAVDEVTAMPGALRGISAKFTQAAAQYRGVDEGSAADLGRLAGRE